MTRTKLEAMALTHLVMQAHSGQQKVFISDKLNVFVMFRFFTYIRVLRDYCTLFARRRLVYDGG